VHPARRRGLCDRQGIRGTRGIVVAVVTACVLATSVARGELPPPQAGAPSVPTLPRERPAATSPEYEAGRRLRATGIALVVVSGVPVLTGLALIAADPAWRPPPRSPLYDTQGNGFPVLATVGGLAAGTALLFLGIPGIALWAVGNSRMADAAARGPAGINLGPGPVGSQGLSLRWRF
jgi:hypothetical protein